MSCNKIVLAVILIFLSTSVVAAQVNFQYNFTLNKPTSALDFNIIQLLDYNNDGNDEVITKYWDENLLLLQIVVSNLNGTVIDTISINEWTCEEYNKFYLMKENEVNYLLRAELDWDTYYLNFLILDCETLSVIDSIIIEPIDDPIYEVNLIDTYERNGERVFLIGAMEMSLLKEDSEENYLYKIIEDNDTLSYVGHFNDCGITNTNPNDSTLLSVGRHSYATVGASAATDHSYYYLQKITKDDPCYQSQLHTTSGTALWEFKARTTYNHYPKNYDIITLNCQDNSPQVLQYRKLDTDNGTSVHFKAYETVNWQEVWSKEDTQIGKGDITTSTCIQVNGEDHYVMYFRGDKLEIRNRINGNIVHHQDSVLAVCDILKKSDGELLFFVEKYDETGYDVYTLDGPIFVSADEPHAQNDFILQNLPNPFRNSTKISFSGTANSHELAQIGIYNVKGQLVRELEIRNSDLGICAACWDGKDINGKVVSPGIYFYKFKTYDKEIVNKMLKID